MRGRCRLARNGGDGPSPARFARDLSRDAGEVKESSRAQTNKIVLAALSCARALPTTTTPKKICSRQSKREAERRKAHANHVRVCADKCARTCATHPLRGCAPKLLLPRLRGKVREGARPPFGAHACGTRHRLSPRWLSPRTGFPEDGLRECFARLALLSSVKHAPCRPVFLPADRGPRAARERIGKSARGHRPSLPSFRLALPERRPP